MKNLILFLLLFPVCYTIPQNKDSLTALPAKSFFTQVTSNGLIAAIYDEKNDVVTSVFPHIFQSYSEGKNVKHFIENIKVSFPEKKIKSSYIANSHVILAEYPGVNIFYFASFIENTPIFYVVIEGATDKVDLTSIRFKPASEKSLHDSTFFSYKEKKRKCYLFSYIDSIVNNSSAMQSAKNRIAKFPDFVEREIAFMLKIFSKSNIPENLNETELNLFKQSITVLKMAQVSQNEVFPYARGQILASLPPGIWNISWVRDGCYSLSALIKLGLFEEAKNYIQFILNADCGYYKKYIHTDGIDYGLKMDYQISVCRYFGIGKEESDFNEAGPNIELDGFGLFLASFSDYIEAARDTSLLLINLTILEEKIADVLLNNMDSDGLIRRESGPWERHLPGKKIAYTSITAAHGLVRYSEMAEKFIKGDNLSRYKKASESILKAIKDNLLVENSFIKGTLEAKSIREHEFLDASTVDLFNFFPAYFSQYFNSHYKYYTENLRFNSSRGYFRVNLGDWYDKQEWVFLDLRTVNALLANNRKDEAIQLRNWIIKQSDANNNLIAELYNEKDAKYEGAVPMVGFGAGAFILTYY